MVELEWAIGGEPLGTRALRRDHLLATPGGSTAYNLSNDGPVLMWGIDAMAVSFVAPHSLHARPLVVPRGRDIVVTNRTPDVSLALIADGQRVGEIEPDGDRHRAARRRAKPAGDAAGRDVPHALPLCLR